MFNLKNFYQLDFGLESLHFCNIVEGGPCICLGCRILIFLLLRASCQVYELSGEHLKMPVSAEIKHSEVGGGSPNNFLIGILILF
jgi:hypothetical protein